MNKDRLLNVFVVVILALMVALTLQGAIETSKVAMAAGGSDHASTAPLCDNPEVQRSSIRQVYVEQMEAWLTYTDGHPTGVDGGLIHLLSDSRVCSK